LAGMLKSPKCYIDLRGEVVALSLKATPVVAIANNK